jgi:hypothetical protein
MQYPVAVDSELLEMLRRSVDLRLDAEGRWFHDGDPFEHARLTELFDRGLDVHPETGEAIVHVGDRWCYVRADDTPFVVVRIERDTPEGPSALLNNGERHPLPPDALETPDGAVVYAVLAPNRRARIGRRVWNALADDVVEVEAGTLAVALAGRLFPIRQQARPRHGGISDRSP